MNLRASSVVIYGMKWSVTDEALGKSGEASPASSASSGIIRRFRTALKQFKRDIRGPLPGTGQSSRFGRIKARVPHLFKRYGWKMFWAIFIFYLIRDVVLYILIPYLVAREIIG